MKFAVTIMLPFLMISCSRKAACNQYGESKKLTFDGQGNIICGRSAELLKGTVRLKDYNLNYTFILDSSHAYVSAYDSIGNLVWKAEPEFENAVGERIKIPVSDIYFKRNRITNPSKVLWVKTGRRAGFFDLRTGKFTLMQI